MNKLGVMNVRDPSAFKCCLCCHVKVGAILYGLLCLCLSAVFFFCWEANLIMLIGFVQQLKKKTNLHGYHKEQLERIKTLALNYLTNAFFPRIVVDWKWNKLSLRTVQFSKMMDIFCLGLVVLMSIHPDILGLQQNQAGKGPEFDGIFADDLEKEFHDASVTETRDVTKENLCMMYAFTLVSIMTAVALLYGVIRSRPGYIVPFFCLHVFLFCLSCLTLVSYFTYAPHYNIKMWIRESGLLNVSGMERVMEIDSDYLTFFLITMLILVLCVKAYLIGMIWACYKYVQQVVVARGMTREYHVDPDTEMLLPPRYEDAIKTQANSTQPPPPPYTQ